VSGNIDGFEHHGEEMDAMQKYNFAVVVHEGGRKCRVQVSGDASAASEQQRGNRARIRMRMIRRELMELIIDQIYREKRDLCIDEIYREQRDLCIDEIDEACGKKDGTNKEKVLMLLDIQWHPAYKDTVTSQKTRQFTHTHTHTA
jgi:hypothetical protein